MNLETMTALELGAAIRKGEISAVEAAKFSLAQIEKYDKKFSCFVTVQDDVLQRAEEVQKKISSGEYTSPLAGVPMGIKDNMCQKGIQTSCGSRMLYNFRPTYSATAVEEIMNAGAVPLGKLNMDEFAMGSTSETSWFGATKNPWNTACVPGGSSGGSAAAVAAGECFYSLGSDTGGSIRQPASFCGVTGIKPTYGSVSRFGLVAYASSLDQIGPLAHNAADCAAVLAEIMKQDKKDNTSVATKGVDLNAVLNTDVKGMKIGIPTYFFGEGLDKEVAAARADGRDARKARGRQSAADGAVLHREERLPRARAERRRRARDRDRGRQPLHGARSDLRERGAEPGGGRRSRGDLERGELRLLPVLAALRGP